MGLIGVAVVAALVLDRVGVNASHWAVVGVGAVCGLIAFGLAFRSKTTLEARIITALALAATALAGPVTAFFVTFGLATGFGGLSALSGAWGDPGMNGVLGQSLV